MSGHRYDVDTDRCTCGGQVVYFEDGDRNGNYGEDCEVADLVFAVDEPLLDVDHPDYGQPEVGSWDPGRMS